MNASSPRTANIVSRAASIREWEVRNPAIALEQPYPPRAAQIYTICVLFMAFTIAYVDRTVTGLLVPSMKADLGLSDTQISIFQGPAFALFFALAGLPIGRLVDRFRRTTIIAAGLVIWSLATAACGLAENYQHLLIARSIVGIGEATLAPAAVSLLADYFIPARRGRALGIVMAGIPVGNAVAAILGGILLEVLVRGTGYAAWMPTHWAPWKSVLVIFGLPGILVAIAVVFMPEPERKDLATPEQSPKLGVTFLRHLWKERGVFGLFFMTFGCNAILGYGVATWAAAMLMRIYHMAPAGAGLLVSLTSCSAVIAAAVSGYFSDFLARRWPSHGRILITIIFIPAQIPTLALFFWVDNIAGVTTILVLTSVFAAILSTNAYAALQDLVPNEFRGQTVAVHVLVYNLLGLGVAPTAVGLTVDHILRDEMKLQQAVGMVGVGAAVCGTILASFLVKTYRDARLRSGVV